MQFQVVPKGIEIRTLLLESVRKLDWEVRDGDGNDLALLVGLVRDGRVEVVEEGGVWVGQRFHDQANLGLSSKVFFQGLQFRSAKVV